MLGICTWLFTASLWIKNPILHHDARTYMDAHYLQQLLINNFEKVKIAAILLILAINANEHR
jgi:hypothetical protein